MEVAEDRRQMPIFCMLIGQQLEYFEHWARQVHRVVEGNPSYQSVGIGLVQQIRLSLLPEVVYAFVMSDKTII
jgi:hypothetical protein